MIRVHETPGPIDSDEIADDGSEYILIENAHKLAKIMLMHVNSIFSYLLPYD